MNLNEYLSALRKRWIVILALSLLGGIAAYGYASTMSDVYRATASLFVSSTKGSTTSELQQGSTFIQNQIQSFAMLATQAVVLQPVLDDLNLDRSYRSLANAVTAENPLNTVIIRVSVVDGSPEQAARIANAVAASLGKAATENSPVDEEGNSTVEMNITSPATVPNNPIAPNTRLIVATGLAIGFLLGAIFAIGREVFDTRIRSERDVLRLGEPIILGVTARPRRGEPTGIAMRVHPHGESAEDFRRIRTNLEFSNVDRRVRSVTVTSALPGEGKSTLSLNLALAAAERRQRVLVIDGDLRRPSVADYTGLEGSAGLTTVLVGRAALADVVQRWSDNVDVLTSGAVPPSPGQMLASASMESLMQEVIASYDFVIIDSPPLLPSADALTLGHLTDGAIVVARYKSTRGNQLGRALGDLRSASVEILGVVISQTEPHRKGSGYYGYTPKTEAGQEEVQTSEKMIRPSATVPTSTSPVELRPFGTEQWVRDGSANPENSAPTLPGKG